MLDWRLNFVSRVSLSHYVNHIKFPIAYLNTQTSPLHHVIFGPTLHAVVSRYVVYIYSVMVVFEVYWSSPSSIDSEK